jgi:hypothetical protein
MKKLFKNLLLIIFLFIACYSSAQQGVVPLQQYFTNQFELQYQDSLYVSLSLKPFIADAPLKYHTIDTVKLPGSKWLQSIQSSGWINYQYKSFTLHINPLMHLSKGMELNEQNFYNNVRGIQGYGYIGKKIYYHTAYYESQSTFPQYITSFVSDTGVVPGQGRVKGLIRKKSFDYGWAESVILYKPNQYIDLSFGQNKNHIGFGYRSMLLSDNTLPYLNLRINVHFGRVHYSVIYASLNNFQKGAVLSQGYEKKYFAAHYLNFYPHKNLEIGLFETVVWPNADSSGYRGFELNYLNPIIFYHATQNYLGSPDNSLIGLNFRFKMLPTLHTYGQFILDDFDIGRSHQKGFYRNKTAIQFGIKWLKAFGLKGLILRTEMNQAQPYTYAHKIPSQSYTAMQQPLAHPLGANFREWVGQIFYEHKRWSADAHVTYAVVGTDIESTHVGNNIFRSDYFIPGFPKSYNNNLFQGVKSNIFNSALTIHYLVMPVNRTTIDLGIQYRSLSNAIGQNLAANFISFGFRTNLFNTYYDF